MSYIRKKIKVLGILSILIATIMATSVCADDGETLLRNVSRTPDLDTEHAAIGIMELYVPAQSADGVILTDGIDYIASDGTTMLETRTDAKPIVTVYQDGHVEPIKDAGGFCGHGKRDAWAALSLDDGTTWKRTNLSLSGDLSSFTMQDKKKSIPYYGDVVRISMAVSGNKVLVAWASRYARGGSPGYAMTDDERSALMTHLDLAEGNLYLTDLFGVTGSQGSSDFTDYGFPQVGEVPFCALWTARGTLEAKTDDQGNIIEGYDIVWRKAERLTSGVRDVNRVEVAVAENVGFTVVWQEDPNGLRPGEGEGPGEGWSGATAHHETDIWYSYIDWINFDLVDGNGDGAYGDPLPLAEYTGTSIPPVGIPMALPVRLSDNAKCMKVDNDGDGIEEDGCPYCYHDFDGSGSPDFCADTVTVIMDTPEGPDQQIEMCVTEDGRLLRGNIAATRPRLALHGYDSDDNGINDSAWMVMAYEESKGLGEEELDAGEEIDLTKVDMGKNIWYQTFDMRNPELVSQGMMLNQPAVYKDDFQAIGSLVDAGHGTFNFMLIEPDPIYEDSVAITQPLETTLYQTEIARRFSLLSQDAADVNNLAGKTVALATWKQGIIRRGGPADVMARRFVIPVGFDSKTHNPYAYGNMQCVDRIFLDGSNPRYVKGLCLDCAINMSSTNIVTCDPESTEATCADAFPWNPYFDDRLGGEELAKVTQWSQTGQSYGTIPTNDWALNDETNLNDLTWENPYEVAKGHRGFMDGDFIMLLYAWSPNQLANSVGHDRYDLYVRRSFDGGQTWTTTPAGWNPEGIDEVNWTADGATTCETYRDLALGTEGWVCTTYSAGDFEPARNVSLLGTMKLTILDPRYTPTRDSIFPTTEDGTVSDTPLYPDDVRDPSKYFIVYETGDNTTTALGEAEPLDLLYGRAINWGDEYVIWSDPTCSECIPPSDNVTDTSVCNEFEPLEGKALSVSGEAGITANPGGTFFYGVWNQEDLDKNHNVIGSDAWFRRTMFVDDGTSIIPDDGSGGDNGGKKPKKEK